MYTLLSVASAAAAAAAVTIVVVVIAAAARAAGATAAAAALVGKEGKLTVHEKLCGVVGVAAEAGKCNNAVCGKSRPCVNADVADDNGVNIKAVHKIGNRLVTGLLDFDDLLGEDLCVVVIGLLNGEHFGMAEVLKYLVVLVRYCNYHEFSPFSIKSASSLRASASILHGRNDGVDGKARGVLNAVFLCYLLDLA